jgi:hypothetical protein
VNIQFIAPDCGNEITKEDVYALCSPWDENRAIRLGKAK